MKETGAFVHFPRLFVEGSVASESVGCIAPLPFDLFEELDDDWAKETYFSRTRVSGWFAPTSMFVTPSKSISMELLPRKDMDGLWDKVVEAAMLVYFAILLRSDRRLPDPRLSIRYIYSGGAVTRQIGLFERTLLLNGDHDAVVTSDIASGAIRSVEVWLQRTITTRNEIFLPLKALAAFYSCEASPVLEILPLIVTIEAYLVGKATKGIAKEISRRLQALLGDACPQDIKSRINKVYSLRSDLLHGRFDDLDQYATEVQFLESLTRSIVDAAMNWVMINGASGNSMDALRKHLDK